MKRKRTPNGHVPPWCIHCEEPFVESDSIGESVVDIVLLSGEAYRFHHRCLKLVARLTDTIFTTSDRRMMLDVYDEMKRRRRSKRRPN